MSHNVRALQGDFRSGVPDGNLGGAFAEIDRRLPRYVIDNTGTCAGMA
jgi:hypothetical protein